MNASAEGSLYELVARGNKDLYFFKEGGEFVFDNAYNAQTPYLEELRRVPPKTSVEFGRTIEFDFDLVGDLMQNPTLLINLPTWLPLTQSKNIRKSVIQDASGMTYGYIQGIAYFLFEKIRFYQDNILLQEFSGDTLWAFSKISGTFGKNFVHDSLSGSHGGSPLEISRNAAPPMLRLQVPLVGCQENSNSGFPQRAAQRHSYRLQCKLRRLEDLVESSDSSTTQKAFPWDKTMIQQMQQSSLTFQTLARSAMGPLTIQLETTQIYVEKDIQQKMETTPMAVRFTRLTENHFTQNQLDYSGVNGSGTSTVTRRLDGRHPASRIMWYFRNLEDVNANRLYKLNTVSNTPYFNTITLLIAGKSRELPRNPLVWRDITNFAKEDTDSGLEINTMNWTFGSIAPERFKDINLTGTVNFSTADKPSLYIDLTRPGPNPSTELFVIVEGWAEFRTDGKGRAELFSMN